MSIEINGKTIKTDAEGYLLNCTDWNLEVREALIKKHEADGHKSVSENTRNLINYFRSYYQKNKIQPSMYKMVLTLGQNPEDKFCQQGAEINCLYELFPHGPVRMLFKLAGLRNPFFQTQAIRLNF